MIIPEKLRVGDEVRIIAPSRSMSIISNDIIDISIKTLNKMGLKVSFAKNVLECDDFSSSSIHSRVEDIHEAFLDINIKGVLTAIGGFNSNNLLNYLDYDLIKRNPKILCGYSDITAIQNAIFAKTGLVTYSGPHFSSFGMLRGLEFTEDYFKKCLFDKSPYGLIPSELWSDDLWFLEQDKRSFSANMGLQILREGVAEGVLIGGNLSTFGLLRGSKFIPKLNGAILFLEEDDILGEDSAVEFDRNLQALILSNDFEQVRGVVIGRFSRSCKISFNILKKIISSKPELFDIPIIANADFGHTTPSVTFPIGGNVKINTQSSNCIVIDKH